jgi:hypothetical protein
MTAEPEQHPFEATTAEAGASGKAERWLRVAARIRRLGAPVRSALVPGITKLVIALPFLAVGVVGASLPYDALQPYGAVLISAAVAVALFAVNFSFVVFNLAPYRALVSGASSRHLAACAAALCASFLPLVGLLFSQGLALRTAAAILPLLAGSSLLLVRLAQHEAEPDGLLHRALNPKALRRFGMAFVQDAKDRQEELDSLDPEPPGAPDRVGPPMHEIFLTPAAAPQARDPFATLVAIARMALELGDIATFDRVVSRALAATEGIRAAAGLLPGEVEEQIGLRSHGVSSVSRLGRLAILSEDPDEPGSRFVERCLERLAARAHETPVDAFELDVLALASGTAAELIDKGNNGPSVLVMTYARRICERAIETVDDPMDRHRLAAYPSTVKLLGQRAVSVRDTDGMYRALEALGWLGCAAVRKDSEDVALTAINGIVQLGREARAEGLECFWSRCALTPYQHALERLDWVVSWVMRRERPEGWLQSLSTAYSRLTGQAIVLSCKPGTDGDGLDVKRLGKPHHESFWHNGGSRQIDYSDPTMLKELMLH